MLCYCPLPAAAVPYRVWTVPPKSCQQWTVRFNQQKKFPSLLKAWSLKKGRTTQSKIHLDSNVTAPYPQVTTFPGSVPLASPPPSPGPLLAVVIPDRFHFTRNDSALKPDSDAKSSSRILGNSLKQLPWPAPQEYKCS